MRQAVRHASQASAHIAHAPPLSSCIRHSAMQASHIAMHARSIDSMAPMSIAIGRSIMRMVVSHTSAHMEHIAAQRPMSAIPAI